MKGDPDVMQSYRERYESALQQLSVIDAASKGDSYRDGNFR